MQKKSKMRPLTEKEMKAVSGAWGITWGKAEVGGGWYVQGFLGKKPGKG